MSFGFSVGDFVTLSSFAWKVYNTCKNSSNEFNFLTREINSLRIVLERTAECLAEHSPNANTAAEFHQLRSDYQEVLSHIDALLDKHRHLGKRRKRRLWDAVRWALEDTASIKESLLLYTSMLTALNTNLINSSQARVEEGMNRLLIAQVDSVAYRDSPSSFPKNRGEQGVVDRSFSTDSTIRCQSPATVLNDDGLEGMRGSGYEGRFNPVPTDEPWGQDSGFCLDEARVTDDSKEESFETHRGDHIYHDIYCEGHSTQVNGNIGFSKAGPQRSHIYSQVIARNNACQVNGDIDTDTFLSFMKG